MKNVSEKDIRPIVKAITKKELLKLPIPSYQRWINHPNVLDLEESIEESGLLRCPIICHIKSEKQDYLIDGNHIREVIKNSTLYKETDLFSCIYTEAETMAEAGSKFRNLNTRGKKMDWIDYTHLYMELNEEKGNVYEIIWHTFLRNPESLKDVHLETGFKLPTIIEFLCKDKVAYKLGDAKKGKDFVGRKNLLQYLISKAPGEWKETFEDKGLIQPNGGSVLGCANYWFSNNLHKQYDESVFLETINDIFLDNQDKLKSRLLTINRDNSAALMGELLEKKSLLC